MWDYDLAVIGSGPAGEKAAAQAAYFGKRVVVIEKQRNLGGACVNTGTLPSKTLRETSLYLSDFRARNLYQGVRLEVRSDISVPEFMCRQGPVCTTELDRIHKNLDRHDIALERGAARFVDAHTLEIVDDGKSRTLTADVILIAVGSSPYQPGHIPFPDPDIDDSDSILELDRIPRSLVVLGAGVIGCEYASIFAAAGVQVTMVEPRDKLLPFLDLEVAELLTRRLAEMGVTTIFKAEAKTVEKWPADGLIHTVLSTGAELVSEKVLYAAGRSGNTAGLALERIGVQPDKRGNLKVDENFRVIGAPGRIYAAGDVIGFPALASTSMEQGRVAMCHAFDLAYKRKVSEHLPYGIYTIPEVSMVGETEQSAAQKGIDYAVGRARYRDNARGQIVGDLDGLLKLVFRADDKRLLGVHLIGERATEIVHVGQMVIHFGGTIDDFIHEVFNYPTLSEMYKYAAYDGLGNLARRATLLAAAGS